MTMNERNQGDDMDNWGEDNDEEESGDDDSDEEIDDDDNNYGDVDDSENSEISDEEEEESGYKIDVEKFIHTFHNGDYDAEIDSKLSLDRSPWHGPARPTQSSYNKPDNWRERNRIGLERVKEQLQICIDHMLHGASFNLDLRHNDRWYQLRDNEEPIVWNESILDEYWNKLGDALSGNELVTEIEGIHIENVEMKKECLAALVAMFVSGRATNYSCTDIIFNNANICGEGTVCLSRLVDISYELRVLTIYHNRIDNIESARCLSRSLKSHTGINHLDLSYCDLGSNPEILLVILQSDVEGIDLSNNNIDSFGAAMIAEYIGSNPPIEYLFLAQNRLNDDDTQLISQALKRNTNLRTLSLRTNNITSISVKALLTCVFDASSLNAISESNHTLRRIDVISVFRPNDKLAFCIDRLLELDRMQKIMLALQDKDSLLQYLANVPVELIPEVLAYSQQGDHQRRHLNVVYSTMRWWNMPMLYSYHNCDKSDSNSKCET
jgi:hypothetical protein